MKIGHEFNAMHGFTGSANPGKNMRPSIPGYAKGGEVVTVEEGAHEHGDHPKNMKHGHKKGHKE